MFKFNVGDIVCTIAAEAQSNAEAVIGIVRHPMTFMIVERLSQECPGGVQRHYKIDDGPPVNEITLMPFSESDHAGRRTKMDEFEMKNAENREAMYEKWSNERRAARRAAEGETKAPYNDVDYSKNTGSGEQLPQ